jgi:hypothetical protein
MSSSDIWIPDVIDLLRMVCPRSFIGFAILYDSIIGPNPMNRLRSSCEEAKNSLVSALMREGEVRRTSRQPKVALRRTSVLGRMLREGYGCPLIRLMV